MQGRHRRPTQHCGDDVHEHNELLECQPAIAISVAVLPGFHEQVLVQPGTHEELPGLSTLDVTIAVAVCPHEKGAILPLLTCRRRPPRRRLGGNSLAHKLRGSPDLLLAAGDHRLQLGDVASGTHHARGPRPRRR